MNNNIEFIRKKYLVDIIDIPIPIFKGKFSS